MGEEARSKGRAVNFYRTSSIRTLKQHPMYDDLRRAFFDDGFQLRGHASRLAITALRVMLPARSDDYFVRQHELSCTVARTIRFYPATWAYLERMRDFYGHYETAEMLASTMLSDKVVEAIYGEKSYIKPFTAAQVEAIREAAK